MKQKEEKVDLEVRVLPDWMKDTPENREYFKRVKEVTEPSIKQDVDGYFYYMQDTKDGYGYLSSTDLKCIAWVLDKLNEPWEQHIEEYFTHGKSNKG
jgi:hypothetical protein